MKNRSLVSIDDFSTAEILKILDLAGEFETAGNILIEKRKEQKREIQSPRKITRASTPDTR
jgi:aspartate carbamoyltransferase catalytic subunit